MAPKWSRGRWRLRIQDEFYGSVWLCNYSHFHETKYDDLVAAQFRYFFSVEQFSQSDNQD
jgi:hypothetical protein